MELSPITEAIRADLAVAAELGDEAVPESLKQLAESAAAADGMSTNAWLVRAVGAALTRQPAARVRVGQRLRGFADS
jgi:hypothetical protein